VNTDMCSLATRSANRIALPRKASHRFEFESIAVFKFMLHLRYQQWRTARLEHSVFGVLLGSIVQVRAGSRTKYPSSFTLPFRDPYAYVLSFQLLRQLIVRHNEPNSGYFGTG